MHKCNDIKEALFNFLNKAVDMVRHNGYNLIVVKYDFMFLTKLPVRLRGKQVKRLCGPATVCDRSICRASSDASLGNREDRHQVPPNNRSRARIPA